MRSVCPNVPVVKTTVFYWLFIYPIIFYFALAAFVAAFGGVTYLVENHAIEIILTIATIVILKKRMITLQ